MGNSTNRNCATCDNTPQRACDVDTLRIKIDLVGGRHGPYELGCNQRLRRTNADNYPSGVRGHLRDNDFVIDAYAGYMDNYHLDTDGSTVVAQVRATSTYHTYKGGCVTNEHPRMQIKIVKGDNKVLNSRTPPNPGRATWSRTEPLRGLAGERVGNTVHLPARDQVLGFSANMLPASLVENKTNLSCFFYLIQSLLDYQSPKIIQISALAHGVRNDGKPARGAGTGVGLQALVRILRDDTIKLVFAVAGPGRESHHSPPAGRLKGFNGVGERLRRERRLSAAGRRPQLTQQNGVSQNQPARSGALKIVADDIQKLREIYRQAKSNVEPRKGSVAAAILVNDQSLSVPLEFKPMMDQLKRNLGEELFARAVVGEHLARTRARKVRAELAQRARNTANTVHSDARALAYDWNSPEGTPKLGLLLSLMFTASFQTTYLRVRDFFSNLRNCIKVGWFFDFDFSLFDGVLGLKASMGEPKRIGPRYYGVNHAFAFYFELNLIKFMLKLCLGAKANFGPFEAAAYFFVSTNTIIQVNSTIELDFWNPGRSEVNFLGQVRFSAGAVAEASALGARATARAEAFADLKIIGALKMSSLPADKKKMDFSCKIHAHPLAVQYVVGVWLPLLGDREATGVWYPWGNQPTTLVTV